jgi:CBS domain containing-hemolysin-like protein
MMMAELSGAAAIWTWAAVAAAAVAMAMLYAGMETGIYVLNKIRLDLRAEGGSRQARILRGLLRRPDHLLAVLLIGSSAATYAATFAIRGLFTAAGCGEWSEWYSLATATLVLFVLGEAVPKNIFQHAAEKLVYRLAVPLKLSSAAFTACGLGPLVRACSSLVLRLVPKRALQARAAQQGFAAIMAEGTASGVLTHFQSVMADRVMRVTQVTLADVMIPMDRVISAPRDIDIDSLKALIRDHNFSRLPLLDGAGQVSGVLDIHEVLLGGDQDQPVGKAVAPLVLPADMSVTDAMYRMQRTHSVMAVTADAGGKHVGIVTIKDLVEEIVGELEAW